MLYSEAAYFDGNHCQHVAAWEEHKRLARIARQCREAHRQNELGGFANSKLFRKQSRGGAWRYYRLLD